MKSRDDFIKQLRENESYKKAMAAARTDAERQMIDHVATRLVLSFADILGPMIDRAEKDSGYAKELAQKLERSLVGQHNVVTTDDPTVSGSVG